MAYLQFMPVDRHDGAFQMDEVSYEGGDGESLIGTLGNLLQIQGPGDGAVGQQYTGVRYQ